MLKPISKNCVCEEYTLKKSKWILLGILIVVIIGILTAVFMEAIMSSNYEMKLRCPIVTVLGDTMECKPCGVL